MAFRPIQGIRTFTARSVAPIGEVARPAQPVASRPVCVQPPAAEEVPADNVPGGGGFVETLKSAVGTTLRVAVDTLSDGISVYRAIGSALAQGSVAWASLFTPRSRWDTPQSYRNRLATPFAAQTIVYGVSVPVLLVVSPALAVLPALCALATHTIACGIRRGDYAAQGY
jgi:hypothetical protein